MNESLFIFEVCGEHNSTIDEIRVEPKVEHEGGIEMASPGQRPDFYGVYVVTGGLPHHISDFTSPLLAKQYATLLRGIYNVPEYMHVGYAYTLLQNQGKQAATEYLLELKRSKLRLANNLYKAEIELLLSLDYDFAASIRSKFNH